MSSRLSGLLGLPELSLNMLCGSVAVIGLGFAIRLALAPNLALKWANIQITTSNSAGKLELVADKLTQKAKIIEQKDEAFEVLEQTYNKYLTHEAGGIELDQAFDAIEELPEVENTEEIQTEISEIEEDLLELTTE